MSFFKLMENSLSIFIGFVVYPVIAILSLPGLALLTFFNSLFSGINKIFLSNDDNNEYTVKPGENTAANIFARIVSAFTMPFAALFNLTYKLIGLIIISPIAGVVQGTKGLSGLAVLFKNLFDTTESEAITESEKSVQHLYIQLRRFMGYQPESSTVTDIMNLITHAMQQPSPLQTTVTGTQAGVQLPSIILSAIYLARTANDIMLETFLQADSPRPTTLSADTIQNLYDVDITSETSHNSWKAILQDKTEGVMDCKIMLYQPETVDDLVLLEKQYCKDNIWHPVASARNVYSKAAIERQLSECNYKEPTTNDSIENPSAVEITGISYSGDEVRYRIIALDTNSKEICKLAQTYYPDLPLPETVNFSC